MKDLLLVLAILSYTHALRATPMDLHGVSVSSAGFVAILTDGKNCVLPIAINDVDKEEVKSPEALAMLQLMQGIDMAGPALPPERLYEGLMMGGSIPSTCSSTMCRLKSVLVASARSFDLMAVVDDDGAETEISFACTSAFEALALALRYKARISATDELLETSGMEAASCLALYPKAFTWRDASEQDKRVRKDLANQLTEATGKSIMPSVPTNANRVVPRALLEKALGMAIEKGDAAAEARIREALKEIPMETPDAE